MNLPFSKMHGAGNDFVMVAGEDLPPAGLDAAAVAALCHRRTGVGADGLIVVGPPPAGAASSEPPVDFVMTYYNRDGGEAEMCGNGARCAVAFARYLGLAGDRCRFSTPAGVVAAEIRADGVEVALPGWRDLALDVDVDGSPFASHHLCDSGVPHLVIPVDDVDAVAVAREGPFLRRHPRPGADGTNVDWVGPAGDGASWRLRTFERGVEAETLACGTGAAAAAVVLVSLGLAVSPVSLHTRGGDILVVTVDTERGTLRLRGPAVTVFTGETRLGDTRPAGSGTQKETT
ncbi:MAG: diaminopimelate epimerase [Candidatus Krumholzibacteriia bacterium]